jgi:hypothetical protein
MNLDIRSPIGILFLLFGVLLAGYGALNPASIRGDFNPNVVWGIVMSVFGGAMLMMARRSK